MLPPRVEAPLTQSVRDYWLDRVRQHTDDWYAGVRISKFPEDLRVYEHLLWLCRPNTVIEIGTHLGGSALWFRDRLRTLSGYGRIRDPRVISLDLTVSAAREAIASVDPGFEESITLVEGDVRDPSLPEVVQRLLPPEPSCLVVEDSAHTYDTTMAALRGFSRFIPVGGFFVVEDGCVDIEEMRLSPDWPRGVLPALHDWLGTEQGSCFVIERGMELYGISCHPQGFLRRIRPG